jgi:lipoprotein-anchoring transpeptidase ErfK/SrfK
VGRRVQIGLVVALALLICAAIGAYAWDQAKAGEIASGIRVGGVPLGGLSEKQAKQRLNRQLVKPLKHPVTVTLEGKKYVLSPSRLKIHADLTGMVNAAQSASREGSFPSRIWRYATGDDVHRNLPAQVGYSRAAVNDFVSAATKAIDRPAQDATVAPTPSSLNAVPGKDGVAVDQTKLRSELINEINSGNQSTINAPVHRTKPQVTTAQLASKYPTYLTIDRGNFTLRLWKNLKLAQSYPIAVGMQGLETPAGVYTINSRIVNPSWQVPNSSWAGSLAGKTIPPGPQDPIKARWLGFFNGAGIHGTDETSSIGTAASHGCIRMLIPDVIALYPQVPLGTPIYIGD